jgi:hypothetical protein
VRRPEALVETSRNRHLRRVDWRFLLPDPTPRRTLCLATGSLADAVQLISSEVVDRADSGCGDCDLAVLVSPSATDVAHAWSALRPGGRLYVELGALPPGGVRRTQRVLESAGFADIRAYLAWPPPALASPRVWLPIGPEDSAAVEYFLATRSPGRSGMVRVATRAASVAFRAAHRGQVLRPVSMVAQKPPLSPDHHQTRLVLSTIGKRTINKIVGLVIADYHPEPRAVVKTVRVPEALPGLAREARVLRGFWDRSPDSKLHIPRVIAFDHHRGILTETVVPGEPLLRRLSHNTFAQIAHSATDWLIELARTGDQRRGVGWRERVLAPVAADFERTWSGVLESALLGKAITALDGLGALPSVPEQRDFAPWNVLIDSNQELGVVDWESAVLDGLPGLDLMYFLAYLAFFVDGAMHGGGFGDAYRALLDPSSRLGSVRAECLARYASTLDLPHDVLPALSCLMWMIHARSEYLRFVGDCAGRPQDAQLRNSVMLALWEEDVRHV